MKQKRRRDEEDLKGMDEEIEALFKKMSKAAEVQDPDLKEVLVVACLSKLLHHLWQHHKLAGRWLPLLIQGEVLLRHVSAFSRQFGGMM